MNKPVKPVRSFIVSILGSAFFTFGAFVLLGLAIFNILAGGETLEEIESRNMGVFLTSLAVLAISYMYSRKFQKGNKSGTIGTILIPSICFLVASCWFVHENYGHTKFDKATWEQSSIKPEGMTISLVRDKRLLGLSRQEVSALLGDYGKRINNADSGCMTYSIANGWSLSVRFTDEKVSEIVLRQRWLSI